MSDDDEQVDEGDWIPPPPDDDEYEDPNPRAATSVPAESLYKPPQQPTARDARRDKAARASALVGGVLEELGLSEMLGELLNQVAQQPVELQTECSHCKHVMAPFYRKCPKCEGDRNRRKVERVAELVSELKSLAVAGDTDASREREIMHQLREYDHPYLDELARWCKQARERGEAKSRGGGGGDFRKSSRW